MVDDRRRAFPIGLTATIGAAMVGAMMGADEGWAQAAPEAGAQTGPQAGTQAGTQAGAQAGTGAETQTGTEALTVTGQRAAFQQTKPHLSRITTSLRDTPQSIAEIPQKLLRDQNDTNILDALRSVPGISIAAGEGGQQGDNLSIRGFNAQNDFYRDGMLDFGSYYRDPFDMDTIEVLKGPSATLFGRGSTGGVVNEVSKRAQTGAITAGTLSFGTDATKRLTIDENVSSRSLGGSALRLNAMVHDAGLAGIDDAHTRRYGIAPSFAMGLNTDTRLRLDYLRQQSYDTQYYGIPWLNGRPAPVSRSSFYGYADSDYLRSIVDSGTIRAEHDFSDAVEIHDQIRYSSFHLGQRAVEPLLLNYGPATNVVLGNRPLSALNVQRNVLALSGPSTLLDNQLEGTAHFRTGFLRHSVVAGFEVQHQTADITRYNYPRVATSLLHPQQDAPFPYGYTLRSVSSSVSNDTAPYINDTIAFGRRWSAIGGWRFDHYTTEYNQIVAPAVHASRTDDRPSWRGALIYKPADNGSIYVSYGDSFDPSGENISLTAATAAVAPESSDTYEVGTKWDLGRLSLTGALYQIEKHNARETDPADATRTILAGNYRSRGFELTAAGHITDRWEVFGGYSYNDVVVVASPNRLEIGNSPPNAPKHTVALWTEYSFPAYRLTFGAGVNYVSSRTASSLPQAGTTIIERAPGYTTLQLMAKYHISSRLTAQVNIQNATDTTYYAALHPSHIVMGPARSALFSLAASY